MENTASYPVFHTRLAGTRRRRFTKPDGTPAGWLIINAADQLTEITWPDNRDGDDPPHLSISHPR